MKRLFVLAVALTVVSGAAWAQQSQTQPQQIPSMAEMDKCRQLKSEVEQTRCLNGGPSMAAAPASGSSSNPSLSQSPSSRQPAQQKK